MEVRNIRSKTEEQLILACFDHFSLAVFAHTFIPVWCDCDIVLHPARQCAEITAVVCATAVVSGTFGICSRHCIHHPCHTIVPGDRYDTSATVHIRKEG